MSDIRVYVTFPESATVFAGENLECKIMFRNVSAIPGSRAVTSGGLVGGGGGGGSQLTPPVTSNGFAPGGNGNAMGERRNKVLPLKSSAADRARSSVMSPRIPSARSSSAHKQPLSMNVLGGKLPTSPVPPKATNGGAVHKHKRSISIVSLSSDIGAESGNRGGGAGEEGGARTPQLQHGRNHSRSASLQLMPRQAPGLPNGFTPKSASFPPHQLPTRKSSRPPTPIIIESETLNSFSFPARRSSPPATPVTPGSAKHSHSKPNSLNKFRFPPEPSGSPLLNNFTSKSDSSTDEGNDNVPRLSRKVSHIDLKSPIDDLDLPEFDHITQSRVISAHSVNGETPRSSGEFYSLSNSTTETLVSDLLAIGPRSPEALMMGYAQVSGTFTLDGSLIQTSIFEEVKRKGVLGGQMGGGVVGLETSKSDGGFLSGFGWGNIGGSLGGLLGGNNMSSIANMKTLANTKSIPILSTPQSILFVDLRLAPGESRSYTYKFALPRGLPPSHRGKAIKITYNLVIGTQRPGKGVQQPKIVEIPFRVFPHVDLNGSMRVHDLMSPIVLLRDEATTTCVEDQVFISSDQSAPKKPPKQESSLEDFMAYVDTLISPQVNGSTSTLNLLSPSLPNLSKRNSFSEEQPTTSKEAIEMAILRGPGNSGRASESNCSMFEIARNGRRVASLTLARPAYKLGETITAVIDFTNSQIPCYNINASLESSETVAPSIALRSASSILRATRKIHSQHSESTLFAKRVLFTPTIPTSATPEFSTSGVSCSWILRLEFITPALSARLGMDDPVIEDLLEQTNVDDRGELFEAKQGIYVESFDACIPVKVYPNAADAGVIGGGSVGVQTAAAAIVGYVV